MTAAAARPPLVRSRDVLLGGVCAALARHLGLPVTVIRMVFAAILGCSAFVAGVAAMIGDQPVFVAGVAASALLYAWLWLLVPREQGPPDAPPTRRVPVAAVLLGAAILAGLVTLVTWRSSATVATGSIEAAVLAAGAIVWALAVDPRDARHASAAPVIRVCAAAFLVLLGALMLPPAILEGRPVVAISASAFVLCGVAAFILPLLLDRWSARAAERAALARDEQRAEIAAHLHDSVLQTLAIIQNRAGAGSEVARIARAQERELRDWLFAGTDPFAGDLATELRTIARELELEHAVRIEVVTVGEVGEVESAALAGAAREALVNAARHAGGDVTVYAEATPDAVEVFVRDRGAGFDTSEVPDGRLGIRESIVGRMARAGGTGVVRSSARGTEVELRMPRRFAQNGGGS